MALSHFEMLMPEATLVEFPSTYPYNLVSNNQHIIINNVTKAHALMIIYNVVVRSYSFEVPL